MNRLALLAAVVIATASLTALAEGPQPYEGFEARPIKSLSDQQIGDLKAGRGMGLALAAELNGYPGPIHVLELAESLGLSELQRAKTQELHTAMKAETVPLGKKLIAQEADLERQFASKTITEPGLEAAIQSISSTQSALRTAHLKYHLATVEILTPTQVTRYAELRGYSGATDNQHNGHKH